MFLVFVFCFVALCASLFFLFKGIKQDCFGVMSFILACLCLIFLFGSSVDYRENLTDQCHVDGFHKSHLGKWYFENDLAPELVKINQIILEQNRLNDSWFWDLDCPDWESPTLYEINYTGETP